MKQVILLVLVLLSLTAQAQVTILSGGGVSSGGGVGGGGGGGGGGAAQIDPWAPATAYVINDLVLYNDTLFRRTVGGTTPTAPDQDNVNWASVDANFLSQWDGGDYYHVGEFVEYNGYLYERLVAGISAGNPAGDAVNWQPLQVDLTSAVTGILPQANGGLGFDATTVTDGQLLIGDTGTGFVSASLTGTVNQVAVANGAGSITLSTPQDIHSGASPTFVSATFSGVLANEFLKTDGASGLTSVASIDLTSDISGVLPIANGGTNSSTALNDDRIMVSSAGSIVEAPALADGELLIGQSGGAPVSGSITGTVNQVAVANGAGSITLSTPQDIHSGASPTFVSATFSGALPNEFLKTDGASGLTTVSSIDLTSDVGTSVLPIANGGTNSATALNNDRMLVTTGGSIVEGSALNDGEFFIGATGGAPDVGTIAGTVNQVNIAYASNSITASLPQDIHTGATPTFASASLGNIDVGSNYVSASNAGGGIDLNPSAPGVVTVNGDMDVTGSLDVSGGFTAGSLDTSSSTISVNVGNTQATAITNNAGLIVEMTDATNAQMEYDNAYNSFFAIGEVGDTREVVTVSHNQILTNKDLSADSNDVGARRNVFRVRNVSGATITKGSLVYATSWNNGQGTFEVALADADDPARNPALGAVQSDINNNANGLVISSGYITDINTNGLTLNQPVYLSTTPGQFTTTRPTASNALVQKVGLVGRVSATQGTLRMVGPGHANDVPNSFSVNGTQSFPNLTANKFLYLDGSNNVTASDVVLTSPSVTGILPIAKGGTATTSVPTNGQLLIGNGTGYAVSALTGTANQVSVTNGAGSITLAGPQDLHAGASPTFVSATFSGVLANEFVKTDGASGLTSVSSIDLTSDISGVLPVANGGTNSSTALSNGRVMVSLGGAIVEDAELKTDTADVALDVDSTTGAFLPPRMTTAQRDALTAVEGMHLYNTTISQPQYYNGTAWISY